MKRIAVIAGHIALAATTSTARANEPVDRISDEVVAREDIKPRTKRRHTLMAIELGAFAALGEMFYFRGDGRANEHDWQLPWDGRALEAKLTGDGWRFDGNSWKTNAIQHPGFGAVTHLMARTNGYSLAESFLISTLASGTWELVLEWAEYASINDILMTSPGGLSIGESVYQVATHLRETHYELRGGVGTDGEASFKTVSGRAALDTTPMGEGMTRGGERIGLALEVPFDDGVRAYEGGAKTNVLGYYNNQADSRLFVGASTEFNYRDKMARANSPADLLATATLGPTIDYSVSRRGMQLDAGVDVYGEFAMVKAWAYKTWKEDHPMETIRNVIRTNEKDYYYGVGASAAPRVNLSYKGARVGGKVVASQFTSLDGADRDKEKLTIKTHQSDRDATAEAWVGYELSGVSVVVDGRMRYRSGEMNEAQAQHRERSVSATVGYRM